MLFTTKGINNYKIKWAVDFFSDDQLPNEVSQYYNRSILRHLFAANEFLIYSFMSIHNLAFYLWTVKEARKRMWQYFCNLEEWDKVPVCRAALEPQVISLLI